MVFEVERVALPKDISSEMKLWRLGMGSIESYVEFHLDLAKKRLRTLVDNYGLEVHSAKVGFDGWGDGMRVLTVVVETRMGELKKLKWMDSNQDFGVVEHGTVALFEKDLK
jgi:hypothetical protein